MPTALLAPDKFKGTLSAAEVSTALAAGFERRGWDVDRCPLADGGEGTAAALVEARGGEWIEAGATDALGRPSAARFALLGDGVAIVEAAAASGLAQLESGALDPIAASSAGTGELILAAAGHAETVLVAIGGTASSDGGAGALAAIDAGGGLAGATRLVCLCDVATPWERAAAEFAPQKGASAEQVAELERRLAALATTLPRDPTALPMGGAGGALAGGLWAGLDAQLVAGAPFVCDAADFNRRAAPADLLVSGEGRLDRTTLEGKVVAEVTRRCRLLGTPVHLVVGADEGDDVLREQLGVASVTEAGTRAALARAGSTLAVGKPAQRP